ncbi:MAG: hypothetical protein N2234_06970 [Planctomycetota bacterium]|nr:hypothetical protein [Planctomycetota bacterium]
MKRLSRGEKIIVLILNLMILPGVGTVVLGRVKWGFVQAMVALPSAMFIVLDWSLLCIRRWLPEELQKVFPGLALPGHLSFVFLCALIGVWLWTLVQTVYILLVWERKEREEAAVEGGE